jgi:hypothetical protein
MHFQQVVPKHPIALPSIPRRSHSQNPSLYKLSLNLRSFTFHHVGEHLRKPLSKNLCLFRQCSQGFVLFVTQLNSHCEQIFLEPGGTPGPEKDMNLFSLSHQPREDQLAGSKVFLLGQPLEFVGEFHVLVEEFLLKPGQHRTPVVLDVLGRLDGSGQKATTQRAIRHDGGPEFLAGVEYGGIAVDAALDVQNPRRIFDL